jgi:hypothetical protein
MGMDVHEKHIFSAPFPPYFPQRLPAVLLIKSLQKE